ncbi:ABC transporter [Secundilactobacillus malefermentans DSM 5705 = KCTC 3548]|nr:ABC transporter [Secundilactobacillus malefermentans DSM 5705 = KCTC 3548]
MLLALLIAVEVSFTQSWSVNLILVLGSLIWLIAVKVAPRKIGLLFLVPILPAIAITISMYLWTDQSVHFILVLVTRIFAYVFVGSVATLTTTLQELILSLEQNAKLPSKFAYGFLGAFNLIPKIINEVAIIRSAGRMRNQTMHFWSPSLYFKAILASLNWSENLAEAMTSHGFVEDVRRTHYRIIHVPHHNYYEFGAILVVLQLLLFATPLP